MSRQDDVYREGLHDYYDDPPEPEMTQAEAQHEMYLDVTPTKGRTTPDDIDRWIDNPPIVRPDDDPF